MDRDLYQYLLKWRQVSDRQPLLLQGARQVGKTFLLKQFGSQEFKNVCYVNFEEMPLCKTFFDLDLSPSRILRDLQVHFEMTILPQETLIIFDEVQQCPNALTSLKYFCEQVPEYCVAAAGSLLGVKLSGARGFPVGKVHFCHLYPMSFFEFLTAMGRHKLRQLLEEVEEIKPIAISHHVQLVDLLKLYFYVGGMPKPVLRYVQTQDVGKVREAQMDILKAYVHDFAKYAPPSLVMKIMGIWESIPIHLGKENKKFIFSAIKPSARAREYEEALQWLVDAELVYRASAVTAPKLPLKGYHDQDGFKIYLLDVGLLGATCHLEASTIVEGNQLFIEFKGSLTENYVAQSLKAASNISLHYWTAAHAEVDFLVERYGQIFPLEVKAGTSTKRKSLLVYQDKYEPQTLACASLLNLQKEKGVCNYPLYLISRFPLHKN